VGSGRVGGGDFLVPLYRTSDGMPGMGLALMVRSRFTITLFIRGDGSRFGIVSR
jgi:hypothetical protein